MTTEIEKLKKLIDNPHTPAAMLPRVKAKIAELEAKEKEKPSEKKEKAEKPKEKKTGEKKKVRKKEPNVVILDGKEYVRGSAEYCKALDDRLQRRMNQARKNAKKARTTPVFSLITDKVTGVALKAMKDSLKENREDVKKHPQKYVDKYEKLEKATKEYLQAFRNVLGDDYKGSELKEMEHTLGAFIDKIKKKIRE